MGLDIYFSGHLHLYERTKQICYNDTVNNHNNSVSFLFKIDPLKNISAKLVYNTGFGILTTAKRNMSY